MNPLRVGPKHVPNPKGPGPEVVAKLNSLGPMYRRGTPGHLGVARANMHQAYYRRLAMPTKYRFLLPLIEGRIAQLAADKGGPENLTAGEIALLDLYRRAHGASMLLIAEAHEKGYIRVAEDGSWDLHPGAAAIARFAEMERRLLMDFGLGRRAKQVDPLQAVRDAVERANEPANQQPEEPTNEEPEE